MQLFGGNGDLFERHHVAGQPVGGAVDHTHGSAAEGLVQLVAVGDSYSHIASLSCQAVHKA